MSDLSISSDIAEKWGPPGPHFVLLKVDSDGVKRIAGQGSAESVGREFAWLTEFGVKNLSIMEMEEWLNDSVSRE